MLIDQLYEYILKRFFDINLVDKKIYVIKPKLEFLSITQISNEAKFHIIKHEIEKISVEKLLEPLLNKYTKTDNKGKINDSLSILKEKVSELSYAEFFEGIVAQFDLFNDIKKIEEQFIQAINESNASFYLYILNFILPDDVFIQTIRSAFCKNHIHSLKSSSEFMSKFSCLPLRKNRFIINQYYEHLITILTDYKDLFYIYNEISECHSAKFNDLINNLYNEAIKNPAPNNIKALFWDDQNIYLYHLFYTLWGDKAYSFITAHHHKMARSTDNNVYMKLIPIAWDCYKRCNNNPFILKTIKNLSYLVIESIKEYVFINRHIVQEKQLIIPQPLRNQCIDASNNCQLLYNRSLSGELSKDDQYLYTAAQIHALLNNTALCVYLLSTFELELKNAWHEQFPNDSIANISGDYYLFTAGSITWKIARNMPEFSSNSFLNRQIIKFLQKRGLGEHGVKLNSFAPHQLFEETIRSGRFFTERNTNPHFLLHGKVTHMIQYIITILACEAKIISLPEGGSYQDLLAALFKCKLKKDNEIIDLWSDVFDTSNRALPTFTDPFVLNASLMLSCRDTLPYLSELTFYTFAKGMHKLKLFFNWTYNLNWDMHKVAVYYIFPRVHYSIQLFASQDNDTGLDCETLDYERYLKSKHTEPSVALSVSSVHRLYTQQYQTISSCPLPDSIQDSNTFLPKF